MLEFGGSPIERHVDWIGFMGKEIIKKESWLVVSLKTKHLSTMIQKYAQRISSQVECLLILINKEEPTRTVETASRVQVIERLFVSALFPRQLYLISLKLLEMDVYVPLDVNTLMESLVTWQRCAFYILCFLLVFY